MTAVKNGSCHGLSDFAGKTVNNGTGKVKRGCITPQKSAEPEIV